jgi:short-subunit dehydrogenase
MSTKTSFTDRVVLITGASNGIGKQLAVDFAAYGATVVGCGRSTARLKETLIEVRRLSPSSAMIGCDVSDAEQVQGMIAKVLADHGRIDILINNAGIGMRQAFVDTPLATIEEILRINYLGAVYCTHEVLPSMLARGHGHIINISSGAGIIGTLNMSAYCASKFAMNGWAESLYHELRPLGIHVAIVCPGPVTTGFNRDFRDSEPKSPASLFVSTQDVSSEVIRTIEKNKFEVIMPRWLALMCAFKRHTPNLFRILAQRKFRTYVLAGRKEVTSLDRTGTN